VPHAFRYTTSTVSVRNHAGSRPSCPRRASGKPVLNRRHGHETAHGQQRAGSGVPSGSPVTAILGSLARDWRIGEHVLEPGGSAGSAGARFAQELLMLDQPVLVASIRRRPHKGVRDELDC
jgi:hypothetical protein